jgi:hypothetical protein
LASSVNDRVIVECVVTSWTRRFRPFSAGSLTQHTTSALPMSSAATRSMICSSSSDSANTNLTSLPSRSIYAA